MKRRHRVLGHLAARRASHSFGYVLLAIGVTFLFAATAPDGAWSTSTLVLLESGTMMIALWTSGLARAGSGINVAFLCLAIGLATADLIWGGDALTGVLGVVSALLALGIVGVVVASVVVRGEIRTFVYWQRADQLVQLANLGSLQPYGMLEDRTDIPWQCRPRGRQILRHSQPGDDEHVGGVDSQRRSQEPEHVRTRLNAIEQFVQ